MIKLFLIFTVIIWNIAVSADDSIGKIRSRNYPITCANLSSVSPYDRDLRHMNCMCDDQCGIYGDCCYDASYNFTTQNNIFECIKFYGSDDRYIAAKCPSEFTDKEIKEKCKSTVVTEEELKNDISLDVPVTDMTTNVTYANQYCAKCNNVNQTSKHLTYWIFKLYCKFSYVMKEDGTGYISIEEGSNSTVITFMGSLYDYCNVERSIPNGIKSSTRLCLGNIVSTCSNSSKTCVGDMQYVQADDKIFLNDMCAQCSSIPYNSIQYCPKYKAPCLNHGATSDASPTVITELPTTITRVRRSRSSKGEENHCDVPVSCSNTSMFPDWRKTWPRGNCYCDNQCSLYDDCCIDLPQNVTRHPKMDFNCVNFYSLDHAYMIVSCKNDTWTGTEIERKCLSYIDDIIYLSPVTNMDSKFTYANIFCAICNGIDTESHDLVYWTKNITFEFKPDNFEEKQKYLKFDASSKKWSFELKRHSYYFSTLLPTNLRGIVRTCVPIVKTCDNTFEDPLIIEKCEKEVINTYVYKHPNDCKPTGSFWWPIAYRNLHCAQCNYQTDKRLSWCLESGSLRIGGFESVFQPISKNIWNNGIYAQVETRTLDSSDAISTTWLSIREAMTYIGIAVSIAFFILHFVLFFAVESLNTNFSGRCISSYSAALFSGYILFCFWDFPSSSFCSLIAISSYYSLTTAFLWMFVMSFDVLRSTSNAVKLRSPSNVDKRQRFIHYSIFCWLSPLIIVAFSLIIEFSTFGGIPKPMFGKGRMCWIGDEAFQLYFFIFPCFALITLNVIFFAITSYWIYSNRKGASITSTKENLSQFKLFGRLALIMGFTWLSAISAFITNSNILWIFYILLNTTQGPFIFFAFSCRRKVIKSFKTKYPLFHSTSFTASKKVTEDTEL